ACAVRKAAHLAHRDARAVSRLKRRLGERRARSRRILGITRSPAGDADENRTGCVRVSRNVHSVPPVSLAGAVARTRGPMDPTRARPIKAAPAEAPRPSGDRTDAGSPCPDGA